MSICRPRRCACCRIPANATCRSRTPRPPRRAKPTLGETATGFANSIEGVARYLPPPAGRQARALRGEGWGGGGRRHQDTHLSLLDPLPRIRPPTPTLPHKGGGGI